MIAMLNKTLTFMKLQLKETDKGYVLTDVLILFGICLFSILYKAFELRSQLALLFKFWRQQKRTDLLCPISAGNR
jgi:hypothetical protein